MFTLLFSVSAESAVNQSLGLLIGGSEARGAFPIFPKRLLFLSLSEMKDGNMNICLIGGLTGFFSCKMDVKSLLLLHNNQIYHSMFRRNEIINKMIS